MEPTDKFYIRARSTPADDRTRVLKHGDTFAVFDRYGDIHGEGGGLFHEDTRYLSALALHLGDELPFLLGSVVQDNNAILTIDLTNADTVLPNGALLRRGTLHLFRSKFIWHGACHERIRVHAFGPEPVQMTLHLQLAADFADIFEVRGAARERRGTVHAPRVEEDGMMVFAYDGLDGRPRSLRVTYAPQPSRVRPNHFEFDLRLEPGHEETIYVAYVCEAAPRAAATSEPPGYERANAALMVTLDAAHAHQADISTANPRFNSWLERSRADLRMMVSDTHHGPYPYAGVPWFSAPFGRDGIITALETLWFDPGIARGVLEFLAATQAEALDPERAAQPGKIVHEIRKGEMAALGEVPFGCYYGTVDATPLFVVLAGAYYDATADRRFVEQLWPSVEAALAWIDEHGDVDGDGFVEYAGDAKGLANQGWKDSADSIFHADGGDAPGPIALCEVQGYVYAAKREAAKLAEVLGRVDRAGELTRAATRLRERFEEVFWCEDLGTYALALDGRKRPCRVRSSNAGHALFAGIAHPERARRMAQSLLEERMYSGWGIRTLGAGEARYNPMSYHNGSVWPHDNALIAQGFAGYGLKAASVAVLTGLFEATTLLDAHRLPELFCGFPRRPGQGPTLYPVACSPQAWASGAVFMLLGACLGLRIDAPRQRLQFNHPMLPPFVSELHLQNLRVGTGAVDLIVHRYPDDVGINVVRRRGSVEVVNSK